MKKTILLITFLAATIADTSLFAQSKNVYIDSNDHIKVGEFDFSRQAINKMVVRKLTFFNNYVVILCNKTDPNLNDVVNKTMVLFNNNDTTRVNITNASTKSKTTKFIRKYLTALSQLQYDHVDVTDHLTVFVSNLQKQPDGTMRGEARFVQDFNATKDGKLVYADKQEKVVTVILKVWDEIIDGKQASKYALFLGDMTITDYRKA